MLYCQHFTVHTAIIAFVCLSCTVLAFLNLQVILWLFVTVNKWELTTSQAVIVSSGCIKSLTAQLIVNETLFFDCFIPSTMCIHIDLLHHLLLHDSKWVQLTTYLVYCNYVYLKWAFLFTVANQFGLFDINYCPVSDLAFFLSFRHYRTFSTWYQVIIVLFNYQHCLLLIPSTTLSLLLLETSHCTQLL